MQDDIILPFDEDEIMPEDDELPDTEAYDQYITAKMMLPRGETFEKSIVRSRKCDADGIFIGKANANPLLDTRLYKVQFSMVPQVNIQLTSFLRTSLPQLMTRDMSVYS